MNARTISSLPPDDDVIATLDRPARERIGAEWLRRAEVELTAAAFTARIVHGLLSDGAIPDVLALAARAVADEVRHAGICHEVAERYLGSPAPSPRARATEDPVFGDCPPPLSRLLALVMHSCVNETLATVCLREGMSLCVAPTAKAATQQLLRDDLNRAHGLGAPRVPQRRRRGPPSRRPCAADPLAPWLRRLDVRTARALR